MSNDASSVRVSVHDEAGQAGGQQVDVDRWGQLAHRSLLSEGVNSGELNLVFVGTSAMSDLNEQHMEGTGPTDVLAFPIDGLEPLAVDPGVPLMLGDVVVCPEVAAANATTHGTSTDDEVALLVVHGVLHVLGHDHVDNEETLLMKTREQELLRRHHHP